jgi:hypothetical protein
MNLGQKQQLFAKYVQKMILFVFENDMGCTLGEAYRTPEQAAIYAQQGKGIKDSLHCQRLAIDINLFDKCGAYLTDSADYKSVGAYWKSLDPACEWGGDWGPTPEHPHQNVDGNHFQLNP